MELIHSYDIYQIFSHYKSGPQPYQLYQRGPHPGLSMEGPTYQNQCPSFPDRNELNKKKNSVFPLYPFKSMASSFNPATPLSYLRSKNQNPNPFPLLLPLPPVRRKSVATGFLAGTPRRRPARSRRKLRPQPPERKMPVGVPMAEVPEESKLLGPIEFEAREMTPSEESRNRESLLILWCYLTCARMFEVLSYTCLVLFFFRNSLSLPYRVLDLVRDRSETHVMYKCWFERSGQMVKFES